MTKKQKAVLIRIVVTFVLFLGLLFAEHFDGFEHLAIVWLPFLLCLVPYLLIGYDILWKAAQSAVSHQLKILKQAKLVNSRRDGKSVFYSLADDHVRTIIGQGLEHIEE